MGKKTLVPLGPYHPLLEEPEFFKLYCDGEIVKEVIWETGYNHRGIEKLCQSKTFEQVFYVVERICGICSASHPFAFCQAVENAAGIEVPERGQYIRVIIAELERIHSHILWAGIAGHELGFDSVLYISWRAREEVLDLLEYLTGNRINYGVFMIGGVRRDITEDQIPRIRKTLEYYKDIYGKIEDIFLKDPTIALRTKNVGVLTKEDALRLCAVGPTTRASGIKKDVRQDQPYSAYADLNVKAITPDVLTGEVNGDVYDRIIVRLLELVQSLEIIEQCLENMPSGEIVAEKKLVKLLNQLKKTKGKGIGRHEAPRGEVFHYVKLAEAEVPEIWKARAPTYNNLMPWAPMLLGEQIADIPIVIASTDPCIACMDRVTILNKANGQKNVLTKKDLHELSVQKTRRIAP